MRFAKTYLERYASGQVGILPPPDPDVFFIVVIPVYDEPDIESTLQSIVNSDDSGLSGEIILVINRPENASESSIIANERTGLFVTRFKSSLSLGKWSIQILEPDPFPVSKAGPGLARKIGMDEAIRRFEKLYRPEGMLISMDADTIVAHDYFFLLSRFIRRYQGIKSYTGYFEHPFNNTAQSEKESEAIMEYEIYLRTIKLGLSWAGFQMSIYSLGSAFGVRAQTYVKAGGMGVQQSGEDFHFLQKCIQLGDFWGFNMLRVYPSGRSSDRVHFGTGLFVKEYTEKHAEGIKKYSWKSFQDLRKIMHEIEMLAYPFSAADLEFSGLEGLSDLLEHLKWKKKILSAMSRSGSEKSFKKWQRREINGFQMVRYLNEHQKKFGSQAITETALSLLHELNQKVESGSRKSILTHLRLYEQSLGNYLVY